MDDYLCEKYSCSIDHYISNEYSICREERQYALYLYNILMKYRDPEIRKYKNDMIVDRVFKECLTNSDKNVSISEVSIKYVWFEATLMRDLFVRNRELYIDEKAEGKDLQNRIKKTPRRKKTDLTVGKNSFNYELIKYCLSVEQSKEKGETRDSKKSIVKLQEIDKQIDEYDFTEMNYGHNSDGGLAEITRGTDIVNLAKRMMNAKPDIALVFEMSGKTYLHFVECKFESPLGKNGEEKQDVLQGRIADFLCKYLNNRDEKIEVSPCMCNEEPTKSRVVHFTRDEVEKCKDGYIWINDLIRLNNEIFGMPQFDRNE